MMNEHIRAAPEGSLRAMLNIIRAVVAFLRQNRRNATTCRMMFSITRKEPSGAAYKCHYLLTYLLTPSEVHGSLQ